MPIIRAGANALPKLQPGIVYPIYPGTGDIHQVNLWTKEMFRLWFPRRKYYLLDIPASKPDSLYQEPTDIESGGEIYSNKDNPLLVHTYTEWPSSKKELTKWGITAERDIVLVFSAAELAELEPDPLNPKSGDVVIVDQTHYKIEETHRRDYWGNTLFPIHIVGFCTRYKHSNLDDDRADTNYAHGPNHPQGSSAPPEEPFNVNDDWE